MKLSAGQWLALGGVAVLMVGLGILFALAQARRDLRERADTTVTANDGVLDCDPGPDPYKSNSITVSNNTEQAIDGLRFDVHRCKYEPGIVEQYRGSFICEPTCDPGEANCRVGVWDGDASNQGFSLAPGESRSFSASANQCEIIQVDVQNPASGNNDAECHNVQSSNTVPSGDRWPGGIAFGISENATGYNATSGTCPQPTIPPTNTPPPAPTSTIPPTSTPQPTAPPGFPTYTPIPTVPFTVTPTSPLGQGGPLPTNTPAPTRPVAGSAELTIFGIAGGIGLVIIAAILLL